VRSYVLDEMACAPYGMFVAKHILAAANQSHKLSDKLTPQISHELSLSGIKLDDVDASSVSHPSHIIVFGKFVEEGDNRLDSLSIASSLLFGLEVAGSDVTGPLSPYEVSVPVSWQALFGEAHSSYDRSMVY
jgi:hypothetical protein